MKFAIVSGSHRPQSQSSKVGGYIQKELEREGHDVFFLDLADNPLHLWDQSKKPEGWEKISQSLESCDGAVIIAPEWNGMVPSGLKNFFLLLGHELAHKPGTLVGVSAGINGAYPIAELRMSSYKNSKICYTPDHVIVRNVADVLNEESSVSDEDKSIRGRITLALNVLGAYAHALTSVRQPEIMNLKRYPFGM